jgi:hypothetical protein
MTPAQTDQWPNIAELLDQAGGHIGIGRVPPIEGAAVAVTETELIASNVRRDGESFRLLHTSPHDVPTTHAIAMMIYLDVDLGPVRKWWSFRQVESNESCSASEQRGYISDPSSPLRASVNTCLIGRLRSFGCKFSWRMTSAPRAQTLS